MGTLEKTQVAPHFFTDAPLQQDFIEQYWVAQYFGNPVLRAFLRICPWWYRQQSSMVLREWKRAKWSRAEYRSAEWMVQRYGVLQTEEKMVQRLSVTYAQWQGIREQLVMSVTTRLFSESLRRHLVDVAWAMQEDVSEVERGPSFIEANCQFSVDWPVGMEVPLAVAPLLAMSKQVVLWMQPPLRVSSEALRVYFSVFSTLTKMHEVRVAGLYDAEMNFGPYQVFGMSLETLRQVLLEGIYGIYYDAERDTVRVVDFYFGAVYNYLHRMLHNSREL